MIVSQPENAADVSILCEVVRVTLGIRATAWRIRRPGDTMDTVLLFNNTDGTGLPGAENFFITDTMQRANLTIRVFDASLNDANITCGTGNDIAVNGTFRLRIISECPPDPLYVCLTDVAAICVAPPVLIMMSDPIVVLENRAFSFNIQQSKGHPAIPTYLWTHNGILINTDTSTNPNVSVYPNIVFNPVMRTQSGNYSMRASTEGGDSTGYFILDAHCE